MSENQQLEACVARIVGAVHISLAETDRAAYGELMPDLVVWAGAPDEIVSVLEAAAETGAEVAIVGPGSSRSGRHRWPQCRTDSSRPRIALDTGRLSNILRLDDTSLLVESQGGITLRFLEDSLQRQGLTLGTFPGSVFDASLGGLLADPSPLATSSSYGPLHEGCIGLRVVTAAGALIESRVAPRRATGPDLAQLFIGGAGALGVITSAVMRVHRRPESLRPLAFHAPNAALALKATQQLFARGIAPQRLQLFANRSAASLLVAHAFPLQSAVALELGGPRECVALAQLRSNEIFAELGGGDLPQEYADRWATSFPEPGFGSTTSFAVPFRYSTLTPAIEALAARLEGPTDYLSCEQLSAHGGHLWLASDEAARASLEALARDAGRSGGGAPRRTKLARQLRDAIDPARRLLSPRWDQPER